MSKKPKIIHIITHLGIGGATSSTLSIVRYLVDRNFEVCLICGENGLFNQYALNTPKLKIYFVKNLVRPISPIKDILCLIQLTRILRSEEPNIVHTHSSKAGILGRLASYLSRVSTVIHTIHGFGFNITNRSLFCKWLILLESLISKITDQLITVSSENMKIGLKYGIGQPFQYRLIRSGIEIDAIKSLAVSQDLSALKISLDIPKDSKIVITVCRLTKQKNPLAFIRLAEAVTQILPSVYFIMVGDGELRDRIEKEILYLDKSNIRLLGWRNDIPSLIKLSDLFVLTSLWEGLPKVAVESLVLGKPIVAFKIDGLKEVITNDRNGFLVSPTSLEDMVKKVLFLLKDEKRLKFFSDNAVHTIDYTFSTLYMCREHEKMYSSLLTHSLRMGNGIKTTTFCL